MASSNVKVSFGVVSDQLGPALDKNNQKMQLSRRVISAAATDYKIYERDAVKALRKIEDKQKRINGSSAIFLELQRRGKLSQKEIVAATKELEAGVMGVGKEQKLLGGSIAEYAAGWLSVGAAVGGVSSLISQVAAKQDELLDSSLTLGERRAKAQAQLIRNTANFSEEQQSQLLAGIEGVAEAVPTASRAALLEAGSRLVSATTSDERGKAGRIEDTVSALGEAAKLLPGQGEDLESVATAILGLQKVTRGVIGKERATDLLQTAASEARITESANLRNIIPALAAIRTAAEKQGDFESEDIIAGLAAFAQVGSQIEDPSGEITRTAVAKFATTLAETVPAEFATGFADQLEFLRSGNEESLAIREKVVGALEGRGFTKPVLEQLVRAIGTSTGFESVLESIEAGTSGRSLRERLGTGTRELESLGELSTIRSVRERVELQRLSQATAREGRKELLKGFGALEGTILGLGSAPLRLVNEQAALALVQAFAESPVETEQSKALSDLGKATESLGKASKGRLAPNLPSKETGN
jgi:hypothetical protein